MFRTYLSNTARVICSIVAFIPSLVPIILWCTNNPIPSPWEWVIILVLLLIIYFLVISFLWRKKIKGIIPDLPANMKDKHPILIVDDDKTILAAIKDLLNEQNYDVVVSKDIQDYRMAERFAIIVCDVLKVGSRNDATNLIKKIQEEYPFKVVIPMSSNPSCKIDVPERLVLKDNPVAYLPVLNEMIKRNEERMNNTKSYWESVENRIGNMCSPKRLEQVRFSYIQYLRTLNGEDVTR